MGSDFDVAVNLLTLEIMDGSAPAKVMRHAMRWIADNREDLIEQWHTLHG